MAYAMVPIYTQTVGAGGAASVTFNNIPSTYNDLLIKVSSRLDANPESSNWSSFKIYFNGDTATNYSYTAMYGTGSGTGSERLSSQTVSQAGWTNSSISTASTYGSADIYISNYLSSNFKQFISDAVSEGNATAAISTMSSGLWRSTAAINSLTLLRSSANFVQYSTFTLYGIKNA